MNEGSRKSVAGSNCVNDLGLEARMGMSERRAKENASVLAARHEPLEELARRDLGARCHAPLRRRA